jgi:general secretion pathway protein H
VGPLIYRSSTNAAERGFTLLELLVVLVIAGLTLGMVSFNAMPSEHQVLQQEAQRIGLLLQLARDEAILRNAPVAFEADGERYHFLIRKGVVWENLQGDDMLRERDFKRAPLGLAIDPPQPGPPLPLRVVLGREPVDKPFALTLSYGESAVTLRADGIGHYVVD